MVTDIFMQSVMEIALPVKKLSSYHQGNLKFVTLKCHTPDKFDQFLEDNFLTGRAISMTLCMKITVTIVLVLNSQRRWKKN
jgi:hypothetical protein